MYIVIHELRVEQFNMLQTLNVMTPLPLFAANMAAHAWTARHGASVIGVGLVVHNARPRREYLPKKGTRDKFAEGLHNKRGANCFMVTGGGARGGDYSSTTLTPTGMSYQPNAGADGVFSLVLEVSDSFQVEDLRKELRGGRLAGGRIASYRRLTTPDNLEEAVASIRRGFWVLDAMDVTQARLAAGKGIVDAVLGRIPGGPGAEDGGWFVPVTIGYSPLTSVEPCAWSREGCDHAYAEACLGLVKLVSSAKLSPSKPLLWRKGWLAAGPDISLFAVSQQLDLSAA